MNQDDDRKYIGESSAFLIAGIGYGMWREILDENKK